MRLFILLFAVSIFSYSQNATGSQEIINSLKYQNDLLNNSLVKNIEFVNIGPSVMSGRVTDIEVNPDDPA